ncbi:hypothetical protein DPEC_G00336940 [Dallia pectoralis]|uniref:Uncharacterized protein n=1 Tax=Dallia pectoralis TaxID=75939 RepID=A0ACC2F7C8_DALPE|nr:hypothetical protein DPEC_G00336940 [Dallia pectoralis]
MPQDSVVLQTQSHPPRPVQQYGAFELRSTLTGLANQRPLTIARSQSISTRLISRPDSARRRIGRTGNILDPAFVLGPHTWLKRGKRHFFSFNPCRRLKSEQTVTLGSLVMKLEQCPCCS